MAVAESMSLRLTDWSRMGFGAPLLVLAILAMMVIPLPPFLLDVFFTFNIALSLIVFTGCCL